MNIVDTEAYRTVFLEYLGGTPIRPSLKQQHPTSHYLWRTQRDQKVRPSHRRNDGRVFSWVEPPATGHPGEDYNCRCEAVPYIEGQTEFAYHDFTTSLASSYDRWTDRDFVRHYFHGNGRPVTLLEIGHLREIAEEYAYNTGIEGHSGGFQVKSPAQHATKDPALWCMTSTSRMISAAFNSRKAAGL